MKKLIIGTLAMAMLACTISAQVQEKTYSIPESMLTQDQKAKLTNRDVPRDVHEWVGIGKEVGEAVNTSLNAITDNANKFAQTGVGRLTVLLVIWKVVGDEIVHLTAGVLELLIFLPLWIWSYRRTCISRRVKIAKDQWQVIEYKVGSGDFTPRIMHTLAIFALVFVFLATVFSY